MIISRSEVERALDNPFVLRILTTVHERLEEIKETEDEEYPTDLYEDELDGAMHRVAVVLYDEGLANSWAKAEDLAFVLMVKE